MFSLSLQLSYSWVAYWDFSYQPLGADSGQVAAVNANRVPIENQDRQQSLLY
jgi:hypothetical protein